MHLVTTMPGESSICCVCGPIRQQARPITTVRLFLDLILSLLLRRSIFLIGQQELRKFLEQILGPIRQKKPGVTISLKYELGWSLALHPALRRLVRRP